MKGMGRFSPLAAGGRLEHAIGALIPPVLPRSAPPAPVVVPVLAATRARRPEPFVLDMARLDASGRFTCRPLLRALDWLPDQPLHVTANADSVLFTASAHGRSRVGRRGDLAIPAPARAMAGLDQQPQVVLVAVLDQAMLIVHPATLVARLLADHYCLDAGDTDE